MSGAISLFILYAFMVQTGTASPYCMEQSYPWEANGHSSSQEIPQSFKLNIYYCIHKSLPLNPITGLEAK
jgi:hypothetical protein